MAVEKKNGGSLLMDCLIELGGHQGFGVPGESYLAVLDALFDRNKKFQLTVCRNEGGASFMAEAWGKLTGRPGLCFVTRGPGATNASIGVHTAMQNSTPMILFVGQVSTAMRGREAFQEIDYNHLFGKLAKWIFEIESVDRIPEIISRAWTTALSGRPGPVVVSVPENVLVAETIKMPCLPVEIPMPDISSQQMKKLEELLGKTHCPVVLYGGGGWSQVGTRQLERFAIKNDFPLVAAFRFQDICDNYHPCYVGDAGVGMLDYVRNLLKNADLILAINVRFGECTTDSYELFDIPNMNAKLVHIHPSDQEIGKIYAPFLPLQANPNNCVSALNKINLPPSKARRKWLRDAKEKYELSFAVAPQPGNLDMGEVLAYLRDVIPEDAIVTNGAGNFAIWPNKFLKFGKKSRLLAPQSGAMGYGIPAAIAAKAFNTERFVLCFAGDGDFQMNGNELGTAMQFGLQPIILVINNGSYGTIRMHQEKLYPQRVSGTELMNPDFVSIARAYGFHGERVEKTADFPKAFKRARGSKTGAILDLVISTEAITPHQSITDIRQNCI